MSTPRKYHHGDLPAALIRASFDLLAEEGLRGFSVAAVARRLGVSTAAPYRHFKDRERLLAAVSAAAARDLRTAITAAAADAGPDPADRFAAAAAAYVTFVARTGAGMNVIFAADLYDVHDEDRTAATRALTTVMLDLTTATGRRPIAESLRLVEAMIAVAHGFTALYTDGFWRRAGRPVSEVATAAAAATRALLP